VLEVRAATVGDRDAVVRVMSVAFDDDPVTRWLVPSGSLEQLFAAHARWSHNAEGCTDIAFSDGEAVGAAFWDPPGFRSPWWRQVAALPVYAVALRRRLARGAALENLMHRARPREPFWYLAGVGAMRRGEGIGTALLQHRLETVSGPAYLESSKEKNIPLYERLGFELRDTLVMPDGPTLWPMWRPRCRPTSGPAEGSHG
jgi:GNAT superfamily N-acetyltransferase